MEIKAEIYIIYKKENEINLINKFNKIKITTVLINSICFVYIKLIILFLTF
jgi:hypothetical protein